MSGLGPFGRDQKSHLRQFRDSAEAGLLVQLTHTECLLALARLSAVVLDLDSYLEQAVAILTEFVPCRACHVTVEAPDIPPASFAYGEPPPDFQPSYRHPLRAVGTLAGELCFVPEIPHLAPASFLGEAAVQISSGLASLIETERLRRQAARARAMQLAQSLAELPGPGILAELVQAVADLPNAIGARLEVDHVALAARMQLEAGEPPSAPTDPLGTVSPVRMTVNWSPEPTAADLLMSEELTNAVLGSLDRAYEHRTLLEEAEKDPLTGVANRRSATRALIAAVAAADRTGSPVGVLYLDLDHFKEVNDRLGHDVGDLVLRLFAAHLSSCARPHDTVARYGGEEFLVICPGLDRDAGARLSQLIIDGTPPACAPALGGSARQTVSGGLVLYPDHGGNPEEVLRAADRALYRAKQCGRNQVLDAG